MLKRTADMSEMLDKEDPGPTYAEIQAALNAAEATITFLRAELERKDAALRICDRVLRFDLRRMIEWGTDYNQAVKDAADATRAALSPAQKEEEA